jgi:hypothetical protein
MTIREYKQAEIALPKLRLAAQRDSKFLPAFIEALVTVKGHAWCMDVKSERHKLAKLIAKEIMIK